MNNRKGMKNKAMALLAIMMVLAITFTVGGVALADESEGRGGETLSFSYLRPVWGAATYVADGAYEQALSEYANIDVDVQIIPVTEYDTKVKTIVAGGSIPDVMWAVGPSDSFWRDMEDQGAFISIDELLDTHPTVKSTVSDSVWEQMRNPNDGKIYFLPRTIAADVPFFLYYRKDLFDAQGIAEPTTIDELTSALEVIRDAYPDIVPITVGNGGLEWMYKDLATSFGTTVGGWVASEEDANLIIPATITENYENFIFWMQKLRSENLLDAEAGINPDSSFGKNKFKAGLAAAYPGGYPDYIEITAALAEVDPEAEVGIMQPLVGPTGIQGGTRTSYPVDRGMYFSASSDVIEQFFDFLEWYLTDGSEFRLYGVEGEMYTVEDGKYNVIADDDRSEDYKSTQVEPLTFIGLPDEQLDWEGTWRPQFETYGISDKFDYWYNKFMDYCEVRYPDYLSPTVQSATSIEIGTQIYEATIGSVYGSIFLDVTGTLDEYKTAVNDWLENGGQTIIDEINAAQTDKSKPSYGE